MSDDYGEGVFHSASAYAAIGVIVGFGVDVTLYLLLGDPVWNEEMALLFGLAGLVKFADKNYMNI